MAQSEELILNITAKLDQALKDVADLQKQIDALAAGTEATITANVQGQADVEALAATTAELDGTEAEVTLGADDQATDVLEEATEAVDDLDGTEAEVAIEADDNATDALGEAQDAVDDLDGASAEVTVEADTEDAASGIDDVTESLAGLNASAIPAVGSLTRLLGPAGIIAAGTAALVGSTKATYDFNQQVEALIDLTGSSAEEASKLVAVFQDFGLDAGGLTGLIGRLVDKLAEMPELAEALNIDASLPPLELFIAAMDSLNADTRDSGERITLLMDIFGRRGVKAANDINTSIGLIGEEMDLIGESRIMSDEDQAAVDAMEDSIAHMKGQFAEIAIEVGSLLIPALNDAFEKLESFGGLVNDIASLGQEESSLTDVFDFMEELPNFGEVYDEFTKLDGAVESLRENFFHLHEVKELLDLGIPPEVIASAKLTDEALAHLAETMADSVGTANAMKGALADGAVSQAEWQEIIADGVITMGEVEAALNDTNVALAENVDLSDKATDATQRINKLNEQFVDDINARITAQEKANEEQDRLTLSTEELADALLALEDPSEALPDVWERLVDQFGKGAVDLELTKDLVDQLAQATNLGAEEITNMAIAEAQLRDERLDEKLKADADAALELAQAMADLKDTIGEIDADDLSNMSSALREVLDASDVTVDFQGAKGSVDDAIDTLQTYVDEHEPIDWAALFDTSQIAAGDIDLDQIRLIQDLRDSVQEGIGLAFEIGGAGAAEHFLETFRAQVVGQGLMTAEEFNTLVGVGPDGAADIYLKLHAEEAKADALAILDSLIGVDPNNPILAYLRLAVQADTIPAQVAEIAARILASEATGLPIKLEEFTQEDIDAALAILEDHDVTVPVLADPAEAEGTIADVEQDDYEATIKGVADTALAARQLLDEASRHRTATIYALADFIAAKTVLDGLQARRTANILAVAYTGEAEAELNHTARRRDAYIYTHTVGGVSSGSSSGPQERTLMTPLAGPMAFGAEEDEVGITPLVGATVSSVPASGVAVVTSAPAPVVNNNTVIVQAGIVGNKNEMDRIISKALRRHVRLNGSRN